MAQNPFSKTNNFVKKPKRNTYDLSFQNNATFNFGTLYPVMCKEVIPGDSLRIEPTFALKFMPMVFPVQTRMNANLHFFYVRNRNLYKDWPDFIAKNKTGLTPPYIQCLKSDSEKFSKMFSTGSLGDYLGLPSTVAGDYGSVYIESEHYSPCCANKLLFCDGIEYGSVDTSAVTPADLRELFVSNFRVGNVKIDDTPYDVPFSLLKNNTGKNDSFAVSEAVGVYNTKSSLSPDDYIFSYSLGVLPYTMLQSWRTRTEDVELSVSFLKKTLPYGNWEEYYNSYIRQSLLVFYDADTEVPSKGSVTPEYYIVSSDGSVRPEPLYPAVNLSEDGKTITVTWRFPRSLFNQIVDRFPEGHSLCPLLLSWCGFDDFPMPSVARPISYYMKQYSLAGTFGEKQSIGGGFCVPSSGFYFYYTGTSATGPYTIEKASLSCPLSPRLSLVTPPAVSDSDAESSPFTSTSDSLSPVPVSALPFRAYESIYNAFYRDIRNNPYDPNGDGNYEYNKYIPTLEGGADTNTYELHRRNWEQDFLTTAVQSPQQGTAPLVGVSGDGTFRFQDESGQTFTAKAIVAEDGTEITGFSLEDSKMPVGNVQFLMDVASAGFTINDFRSVNSFQRWLETNMRKGLRYRDQIMAHYGVSVRYDELDMPEFIGGMSVPVTVNQVTQTTPTDGSPLGMYAGQASAIGKGRSVTKYFDEHGFIMAIFSVTPVPNYSQLLPKYFLKTDALDYFFPEFGHIGYQPIFYNEVCPLQGYNAGGASELQKVFGYQRAWYEYLASTDEVHGEFRTTLRNYLINRVFSQAPELSEEFLLVDPEQVNDVFAVTTEDTGDKILGQIYFKISAKRPIPLFGIPKIDG